jgi:RecA-family ATPase
VQPEAILAIPLPPTDEPALRETAPISTLRTGLNLGQPATIDVQACIAAIGRGEDFHNNARDLVASFVGQGQSDKTIIATLTKLLLEGGSDGGTINELPELIRSAREKYGIPDPVDPAAGQDQQQEQAPPPDDLCLTVDQWRARDIPPRDFLLCSMHATTTRAFLYAPTGLGKTHLGFAIAAAMATGSDFCHWKGIRPAKVLIVDGEMPLDLVQERLLDAERRMGKPLDNLFVFCNEDAPDMPPLDTPGGQQWINSLIDKIGGIDFVIFDNLMSLTTGKMADEESWTPIKPWVKALTRSRIGQLWISHTGHNAEHGFGTATRGWHIATRLCIIPFPVRVSRLYRYTLFTALYRIYRKTG